jgi:hypothetical protein
MLFANPWKLNQDRLDQWHRMEIVLVNNNYFNIANFMLKMIIGISTGALTFSVVLININIGLNHHELLIATWVSLIITIFIGMVCGGLSYLAMYKKRENLPDYYDKLYEVEPEEWRNVPEGSNICNDILYPLNFVLAGIFVISFGLMVWFLIAIVLDIVSNIPTCY